MLELLAYAPEDGWAYIREDGEVRLVRPPYTFSTSQIADEHAMETAIQRFGFFPPDKKRTFSSYHELINFFKKEIVRSWKESGKELPETVDLQRSLKLSSVEVLTRFLDKIEKELLPTQKWEHAKNLLTNMLTIPKVQRIGLFLDRVATLLRETLRADNCDRKDKIMLLGGEKQIQKKFHRLFKKFKTSTIIEHSERIREQRQILSFG